MGRLVRLKRMDDLEHMLIFEIASSASVCLCRALATTRLIRSPRYLDLTPTHPVLILFAGAGDFCESFVQQAFPH
jgi:hypothetical protein